MICIKKDDIVGIRFKHHNSYYLSTGEILLSNEIKYFTVISYNELNTIEKSKIDDIVFLFGEGMF